MYFWNVFQLASAIKAPDADKPPAGDAPAPAAGATPAASAATPTLVNLELTPEITSDSPLETRNLAFYTQTIGEGNISAPTVVERIVERFKIIEPCLLLFGRLIKGIFPQFGRTVLIN